MNNPIIQRELIGILRTRKALAIQIGVAVTCAALVLLRWPSDARVGLSSVRSLEMLRLFGYGLLSVLLLLVPAFPATSIVREKRQGTLALLLNSPMTAWSIYVGKLAGVVGFAVLPLLMSLPAAAACYAMGGIDFWRGLAALYGILLLVVVEYAALGLWVSRLANTTDGALRVTYGLALLLAGIAILPHQFLHGTSDSWMARGAEWMRCLSPITPVMEILGQGDVVEHGLLSTAGAPARFVLLSIALSLFFIVSTAFGLKQTMLDRARPQGAITNDRSLVVRFLRRIVFLVDPQRRARAISLWTNPVMVKEFRSRKFGRSHWLLRLVAVCALVSLGLTYAATMGTLDWGVETIGGIMVLLQGALIVLLTPSLAAGLLSSEHENGGWTLLRMTPLSVGSILRGKLLSVVWPLLLVLLATLPGYAVMIWIKPVLTQPICHVIACLVVAAVLSLTVSATVSSFFRRTAPATVTAYSILIAVYGGTMLVWVGRDAPFGHSVVESALALNPLAAALTILEVPGFTQYRPLPAGWWTAGILIAFCLILLTARTWRLTRPE